MKKSLLTFLFVLATINVVAQPPHKFSPEKFQTELENFIKSEASLSKIESAAFFPVYREMRKKQRTIFEQIIKHKKANPADNEAATEAIKQQDKLELEMKQLLKTYHEKFIKMLPATTVFKILKAEDKFHRQLIKGKK